MIFTKGNFPIESGLQLDLPLNPEKPPFEWVEKINRPDGTFTPRGNLLFCPGFYFIPIQFTTSKTCENLFQTRVDINHNGVGKVYFMLRS